MIKIDKTASEGSIKKVINYLESRGYTGIKADCEGYETPRVFKNEKKGIEIIPDIVAEKNGNKHFFDIGMKSEKTRLLKSKWLLLDSWARARAAKFRVLVPRGHYKYAADAIEDIGLKPSVMMKMSAI